MRNNTTPLTNVSIWLLAFIVALDAVLWKLQPITEALTYTRLVHGSGCVSNAGTSPRK